MELFADGQLLRAGGFALAAGLAGAGALLFLHVVPARLEAGGVGILRIVVHHPEIAGDIHAERAGHAVLAVRAGDERTGPDRLAHLVHNLHFRLAERLKMRERRQIVLHLLLIRHAGEDNGAVIQTADPAHRPGSDGHIRTRLPEHRRDLLAQGREAAALDRLHDDHRDAALAAQLVALHAGLNVDVHVIELNLAEIPVAVGRNLFKHLIGIMEGEAQTMDTAQLLLLDQIIENAGFLDHLPVAGVNAVQQIEIEVLHLKRPELSLVNLLRLVERMDHRQRQLGRQIEALPRILLQRTADEFLAGAVMIEIRSVEIIDARLIRAVEHRLGARLVDSALIVQRETHAAKAQTRRLGADFFKHSKFHSDILRLYPVLFYHLLSYDSMPVRFCQTGKGKSGLPPGRPLYMRLRINQ